jgi:mannose-6-phosphate isomerase-like protein (cupin superfamily)
LLGTADVHRTGANKCTERQDELYFVHQGTARFDIDGDSVELGPGAIVHVESTTPRQATNVGTEDLVLLIVGGKGGYVGRDGRLVDPADLPKRQAISRGDFGV